MNKKERYRDIFEWFKINQPVVKTELHYKSAYELIVAVILSAQCTDKRVNIITPEFFKSFPTEKELAKADHQFVFDHIRTCSYPNSKTGYLIGMAKMLHKEFKGIVPSDVDELQMMPGVGRKTANVVASVIYNKPAMAVDTHVFRVSARLGLTTNAKNPLQAELQLIKYIPEKIIPDAHHWLILHGRYVCIARKPKCDECGIKEFCKFHKKLAHS